jgi:hypothetical protein
MVGWRNSSRSGIKKGVQASLTTWGAGNQYAAYIASPGVAYDGTLEQIITQKWIANFTVAHESWNDWRRTGYPALTIREQRYEAVHAMEVPVPQRGNCKKQPELSECHFNPGSNAIYRAGWK